MALDPLTGYSRVMIPFFARHPFARFRLLSKSADFENVLDLDHGGHTVLCWSLNPPEVRKDYEVVTPPIAERIEAMARCAAVGYPIRIMLMPIIPVEDWRQVYGDLLEQLLTRVRLDRITLGGVCSYGPALNVTHEKLGTDNAIEVADRAEQRLGRRADAVLPCPAGRTVRLHAGHDPPLPAGVDRRFVHGVTRPRGRDGAGREHR
jgi:hypothetical protein